MDKTIRAGLEKKPYRYDQTVPPGILSELAGFGGGPAPGERLPDFDMLTTDGRRARRGDFGRRPLLITFASLTCPMSAACANPLKRLYAKHGRDAAFLSVYVREALPGDRVPQARDRDEKLNFAHRYQQRDRIPWPVAVDSLEGDFHRLMGEHPNACYVVDENGVVAFRALWSSDESSIGRALSRMIAGEPLGIVESRAKAAALLGGVGAMSEVLETAGPRAQKAVFRKSPPLYGLGKLAGAFKPLPPPARAAAALTLVAGALTAVAAVLTRRSTAGRAAPERGPAGSRSRRASAPLRRGAS